MKRLLFLCLPLPLDMHRVETSYDVQLSYSKIIEALSPEKIIEYSGMYELRSRKQTDGDEELVVRFEDEKMVINFTEIKNGYKYEFSQSELFDERYSKIAVAEEEPTTVTIESRYTFGSIWSFIIDRLAATSVQREHETMIMNLVEEIDRDSESR